MQVTGYTYSVPFKDLMIEGAQKYNAQLDKEYSSKAQKYGKVALEAIYSVGIIPLIKIVDQANVAEEEHKEEVTELVDIKYTVEETIVHHKVRKVEPPLQDMLVKAKKLVKEKVREELKEYLEKIRVTEEDEERARVGAEELRVRLEEAAAAKKEGEENNEVPEEGDEEGRQDLKGKSEE